MFSALVVLVIGFGGVVFLLIAAERMVDGGNDVIDDDEGRDSNGFWKAEINEYIFVPGSVPHEMFMADDD